MDSVPLVTPKVHPASREMLPDDPLQVQAFEIPGEPRLMLRMLIEEYARMGFDKAAILALAHNPNYQAFHGLQQYFGQQQLSLEVQAILARCGVMRVTAREATPPEAHLVMLDTDLKSADRKHSMTNEPPAVTICPRADEGAIHG